MARTHERVVALVLAILFFATSVGVGALVIWQATQDEGSDTSMDESKGLKGTKLASFTPVAKVDALQPVDTKVGTGKEIMAGDVGTTVTVDYTGALAKDGTIFQSSLDLGQPVSFKLDEVIAGWRDGMVGMKEGGQRRLLIPAALAYGAESREGIPSNSDLVFDITLHHIGE